ncbi:MAG: anaerobic sulfatase maturase [Spirochaetota bacterium]
MPPFTLLIKPASADCNIECTYCFYLEKKELYPGVRRHRMSPQVLERMIAAYMRTSQPTYSFGWQGGEPTLLGRRFFERVTELQERYAPPGASVANSLQTNGMLMTDEFADHLARYRFLVGISIDGPRDVHDRYRVTAGGRGTHRQVLRGIEILDRTGVEYNVLTLVSQANVGRAREVYRYLRDELGVTYHQYIPCVEFDEKGNLLPFAITGEQWGTFLLEIFDEWHGGDEETVSVRLFDSILTMLVDGYANTCVMGRNCRRYFVVEHNGDVYPCDFFVRPELRLGNVTRDRFEDMWNSKTFRDFGRAKRHWNEACARCPYLKLCAGDCQKMRYAGGEDPHMLSVLCDGWKAFYGNTLEEFEKLAEHVRRRRKGVPLGSSGPAGLHS